MGFSLMAEQASIGGKPGFIALPIGKLATIWPQMGIQIFAVGERLEGGIGLLGGDEPTCRCIFAQSVRDCIRLCLSWGSGTFHLPWEWHRITGGSGLSLYRLGHPWQSGYPGIFGFHPVNHFDQMLIGLAWVVPAVDWRDCSRKLGQYGLCAQEFFDNLTCATTMWRFQ